MHFQPFAAPLIAERIPWPSLPQPRVPGGALAAAQGGLQGGAGGCGALQAAFAHPGPALVDVLTNPSELAMPPQVELGAVKGFSIWAIRSVLNGRGDQVLDLIETNPISGILR